MLEKTIPEKNSGDAFLKSILNSIIQFKTNIQNKIITE